jgi:hypothetical protein
VTMRWLALPLLALAACGEPAAARVTPTDRFAFPTSVELTSRVDGGGTALVVASGNFDLTYDGATGGTLLSVDPALAADGGSAIAGGGALVRLGEGAHVGSFVGQVAVVDAASCAGTGTAARPPEVLVTTRFADQVWRVPLGLDGALDACSGAGCTVPVDARLHDPFGLTLACRPDGQRRSAFVSYLRTAQLDTGVVAGWLTEVDLDAPGALARTIAVGPYALAGMAYDDRTDRLFVLGLPVLAAPIYTLDLAPCPAGVAACPTPSVAVVDLANAMAGLELQAIALSNHQAGLGRRAYVSARVYDAALAARLGGRPSADVAAVLLVLDLEEDARGFPALRVLRIVPIGLGPSQVKVLPVRAPLGGTVPRRDVVVVTSSVDGVVTVFDDEQGQVVRIIPLDGSTGAPEAGRSPFGLAAERLAGATPAEDVARVYVAAYQANVVSVVDVPLDVPGQAHALRDAAGTLIRIGGLQ